MPHPRLRPKGSTPAKEASSAVDCKARYSSVMAAIHDRLRSAARVRIGAEFAAKASPELLELLEAQTRGGDVRELPAMRCARTAPVNDGTAIVEVDKEA